LGYTVGGIDDDTDIKMFLARFWRRRLRSWTFKETIKKTKEVTTNEQGTEDEKKKKDHDIFRNIPQSCVFNSKQTEFHQGYKTSKNIYFTEWFQLSHNLQFLRQITV